MHFLAMCHKLVLFFLPSTKENKSTSSKILQFLILGRSFMIVLCYLFSVLNSFCKVDLTFIAGHVLFCFLFEEVSEYSCLVTLLLNRTTSLIDFNVVMECNERTIPPMNKDISPRCILCLTPCNWV